MSDLTKPPAPSEPAQPESEPGSEPGPVAQQLDAPQQSELPQRSEPPQQSQPTQPPYPSQPPQIPQQPQPAQQSNLPQQPQRQQHPYPYQNPYPQQPPYGGAPGGFPPPPTAWAVPPQLAGPSRAPRPWLWTALRWSVAAGLFLLVGAATAIGVAAPARTDLPGLGTPSDHRYAFPPLKLPPLPPGAVGPNESHAAGGDQAHAADLRKLLLPGPVGAKPDSSFPGSTGWYSPTAYAAKFNDQSSLLAQFADSGLRHIAATAWTGPDGTRTEIYLLAYRSSTTASNGFSYDGDNSVLLAESGANVDSGIRFPGIGSGSVIAEVGPLTASEPAADIAYLSCGDVEVVVMMTNPRSVNPVTFKQVVGLQNELLQG
jgi:hypothetical protein